MQICEIGSSHILYFTFLYLKTVCYPSDFILLDIFYFICVNVLFDFSIRKLTSSNECPYCIVNCLKWIARDILACGVVYFALN